MAVLRLITEQDFRSSRYGQVADQIEGRLSDLIAQAEDHIEHKLDRKLSLQGYTELHRPQGQRLFVRERPITEITAVNVRESHNSDWTSLDAANFEADREGRNGVIISLDDQIRGYETRVTYKAGYSPVPADIKAAVILQSVIFAQQDLNVYNAGDNKRPGILYLQDQVDLYVKSYRRLVVL